MAQPTALADLHPTTSVPRVINVDKKAAYPKAMAALKAAGILPELVELRQVNYLNNLVEQDHRLIKRLVKPGKGLLSLPDCMANAARLGGHEYDQEGTATRCGEGRHQEPGQPHRQPVCSSSLS